MIFALRLVGQNAAIGDADDAIFHAVDQSAVVRRHQNRCAARVDALQNLGDVPRGLRVEVAGRFVGDQNQGIVDNRARNRDTLRFAARQFMGPRVGFVAKPHGFQSARHIAHQTLLRRADDLQGEGDVFPNRFLPQKLEILKYDADLAAQQRNLARGQTRYILSVNHDRAAMAVRAAINQLEQSAFARARRPDEKHPFARRH